MEITKDILDNREEIINIHHLLTSHKIAYTNLEDVNDCIVTISNMYSTSIEDVIKIVFTNISNIINHKPISAIDPTDTIADIGLYGVAVGDSLGAPFEFTRATPKLKYTGIISDIPSVCSIPICENDYTSTFCYR